MSSSSSSPRGSSLPELTAIMQKLLSPQGCPWDRDQSLVTLKPYLVEETYEVLEAMEAQDHASHKEELGDLLLQIVFQSALQENDGHFNIDDVVASISEKLTRRHPHVFGNATAETADAVVEQWEAIKKREKAARKNSTDSGKERTLAGIPVGLPALIRAYQLSRRAAKVGFDWPDVAGCREKVNEELKELDAAVASKNAAEMEHEFGDLLFAIVSLGRKLGIDSEAALRQQNRRFEQRFSYVEDELEKQGKTPKTSNLAEMDKLWDAAKQNAQ